MCAEHWIPLDGPRGVVHAGRPRQPTPQGRGQLSNISIVNKGWTGQPSVDRTTHTTSVFDYLI